MPALVSGPLLRRKGYFSNSLIHITDWFPTILGLAGGGPVPPGVDGVNQWKTLSEGGRSARNSFVYNLLGRGPSLRGAIRMGDFKLILGPAGIPDGWYPEPTLPNDFYVIDYNRRKTFTNSVSLFNLRGDPQERRDLSSRMPGMVKVMQRELRARASDMRPPDDFPDDPRGDPRQWGGAFSPGWCEPPVYPRTHR